MKFKLFTTLFLCASTMLLLACNGTNSDKASDSKYARDSVPYVPTNAPPDSSRSK